MTKRSMAEQSQNYAEQECQSLVLTDKAALCHSNNRNSPPLTVAILALGLWELYSAAGSTWPPM